MLADNFVIACFLLAIRVRGRYRMAKTAQRLGASRHGAVTADAWHPVLTGIRPALCAPLPAPSFASMLKLAALLTLLRAAPAAAESRQVSRVTAGCIFHGA